MLKILLFSSANVADIEVRPGLHIDPIVPREPPEFTVCVTSRLARSGKIRSILADFLNFIRHWIDAPVAFYSSGSVVAIHSSSRYPSDGWLVCQRWFISNIECCSGSEGEAIFKWRLRLTKHFNDFNQRTSIYHMLLPKPLGSFHIIERLIICLRHRPCRVGIATWVSQIGQMAQR